MIMTIYFKVWKMLGLFPVDDFLLFFILLFCSSISLGLSFASSSFILLIIDSLFFLVSFTMVFSIFLLFSLNIFLICFLFAAHRQNFSDFNGVCFSKQSLHFFNFKHQ